MTITSGPAALIPARLRPGDLAALASVGLRTRKLRAALSALGIAIGVAAIVAVLGLASSSQAGLLAEIAQLGTNLLTVTNGTTIDGQPAELPDAAPGMVGQLADVTAVQDTGTISADVYRSPLIPSIDTDGLSVDAASLGLPSVAGTSVAQGSYLNAATAKEPVAVLGAEAAQLMGIDRIWPGERIWVGGQWFYLVGILNPATLAPQIDTSILGSAGSAPLSSSAPSPDSCPPSAPPACHPHKHSGPSDTTTSASAASGPSRPSRRYLGQAEGGEQARVVERGDPRQAGPGDGEHLDGVSTVDAVVFAHVGSERGLAVGRDRDHAEGSRPAQDPRGHEKADGLTTGVPGGQRGHLEHGVIAQQPDQAGHVGVLERRGVPAEQRLDARVVRLADLLFGRGCLREMRPGPLQRAVHGDGAGAEQPGYLG
jgi:hypothetical protein